MSGARPSAPTYVTLGTGSSRTLIGQCLEGHRHHDVHSQRCVDADDCGVTMHGGRLEHRRSRARACG
jgi:hypothetical protein